MSQSKFDQNVEAIHKWSLKILDELGVEFHSDRIVQKFRENGFRTEGHVVFMTEAQVQDALDATPSGFVVRARNSKYDMDFNSREKTYLFPGYGCPGVIEEDGRKRNARRDDYIRFVKMTEASDAFHINGGVVVQPYDVAAADSPMVMLYDTLVHSEKCIMNIPVDGRTMRNNMKMMEMVFGKDDLQKNVRCLTLINSLSPLGIGEQTCEVIECCCEYNQPVIITPGPTAGTTSPIRVAGTLACGNAEALAVIVLAQMLRRGVPLVYGMVANVANMRNCITSIGSPGYLLEHKYSVALARYYNMPSRSGGTQTDAARVGVQSGIESAMGMFETYTSKPNLTIHSAGILDDFNAMSYEKFVCDLEVIARMKYYFADIVVDEESICMDDLREVGRDSVFFMLDSTIEYLRKEPYMPQIGVNEIVDDPRTYPEMLDKTIHKALEKLEASYVKPVLPKETLEQLKAYMDQVCTKKYEL